jgi:hypothetical protein
MVADLFLQSYIDCISDHHTHAERFGSDTPSRRSSTVNKDKTGLFGWIEVGWEWRTLGMAGWYPLSFVRNIFFLAISNMYAHKFSLSVDYFNITNYLYNRITLTQNM